MARFRAVITGNKGETSRLGTEKTGMMATINGWDLGVRVIASVDDEGNDTFDIYETKGSNGYGASKLVMTIKGGDR